MTLDEAARRLRDADQLARDAKADWDSAKKEADEAQRRYNEACVQAEKAAGDLVNTASPKQEGDRGRH